jgi:hypothetical protein
MDDTLTGEAEGAEKPVYRKWWVWAATAVAVSLIIALARGDNGSKADEDLPGFPDPPDR